MKRLARTLKCILNIDLGAIAFILGVSGFVVLAFREYTGKFLNLNASCLIISSFLLLIIGISVIILNKDNKKYDTRPITENPGLKSSLEIGMDLAWKDHHHARNQTWEALKMEILLAIALIGVDVSKVMGGALPIGSILLFLLTISGIMITLHHRDLERRKFRHLMHCEDALGLRPYIDGVDLPRPIYIWDVFFPWKSNTILFILRMHFALLTISLIFFLIKIK